MITQTQVNKFPAWWIKYLQGGGRKAVQNLNRNDLKIPFPDASADEINKIYNYIISETKKVNVTGVIDLTQLNLVPLTGLEEAQKVLTDIAKSDTTPLLLLAGLVLGALFLFKK